MEGSVLKEVEEAYEEIEDVLGPYRVMRDDLLQIDSKGLSTFRVSDMSKTEPYLSEEQKKTLWLAQADYCKALMDLKTAYYKYNTECCLILGVLLRK